MLGFYTVFYTIWLAWIHYIRYSEFGLICSGYYKTDDEELTEEEFQNSKAPQYAIQSGASL